MRSSMHSISVMPYGAQSWCSLNDGSYFWLVSECALRPSELPVVSHAAGNPQNGGMKERK